MPRFLSGSASFCPLCSALLSPPLPLERERLLLRRSGGDGILRDLLGGLCLLGPGDLDLLLLLWLLDLDLVGLLRFLPPDLLLLLGLLDLPCLLRLLDLLRLLGLLVLLRRLMFLETERLLLRRGLLVLLRLKEPSGSRSLCLTLSEWGGRGGGEGLLERDGTSWYCLGGVRRGGGLAFWEGDLDLLLEELGLSPPLLPCPGLVLLLSVTSWPLLLPLGRGAPAGLVRSCCVGLYLCCPLLSDMGAPAGGL